MDEVSLASGVDARRDLQKTMALESREGLTGIIVGMGCIGVLLTAWLVISQLFRGPACIAAGCGHNDQRRCPSSTVATMTSPIEGAMGLGERIG